MLAAWTIEQTQPEPGRLDLRLRPEDLLAAVKALVDAARGYLSAITGLDHGEAAGHMEVLYHFCSGAAVVTLRASAPRAVPAVPSVCRLIPSASPFERE